jgi:hypothetical protein
MEGEGIRREPEGIRQSLLCGGVVRQQLEFLRPDLTFGPDAGQAGERSFRDFFRLPPTKENRRQSVDLRVICLGIS